MTECVSHYASGKAPGGSRFLGAAPPAPFSRVADGEGTISVRAVTKPGHERLR